MYIKVFTTDPTISNWKTLQLKKERAESVLVSQGNLVSRVDIEFHKIEDFRPKVGSNGKFEMRWLDLIIPTEIAKGYTHVAFHFTTNQATDLGLMNYVDKYNNINIGVLIMDETQDISIEEKVLLLL